MMTHRARTCLALFAIAGTAHAGGVPRAVVADVGDLAVIPGQGGVLVGSFTQATVRTSKSGERWAMAINAAGQPTTNDTFILVGSPTGVVHVVPETVALPGVGFGFNGRPNAQLGVNDAGDLAFKAVTTAPAATNDMVIKYSGASGQYAIIAREGSPVPSVPTELYGPLLDSVTMLNDGAVAFRAASTVGPLPSTESDFILLAGNPLTTLLQSGFFTPTNQFGGTTAPVIDIVDEAYVAEDRQSYLIDGSINVAAANARVVVVNGRVVVQAGVAVTGLTEPPFNGVVDEARMFPGGDWAAWGSTATSVTSFLLVNDELRAKEGDPVPGGAPGEAINSISDAAMNSRGDLVYAITTTAGRTMIIADGVDTPPFIAVTNYASGFDVTSATQVDLTGDGLLDDAYCIFLTDDTLALGDNGVLYFVMRTINSTTFLRAGDALFAYPLGLLAPSCYPNCDGSTATPVLNALDFACFLTRYRAGESYANCDGSTATPTLNALDFGCFLSRYAAGCR